MSAGGAGYRGGLAAAVANDGATDVPTPYEQRLWR